MGHFIYSGRYLLKMERPNINNTVFCTYFDKGFLLKGLALHSSLIKYQPKAKLWILAFDKYTENLLKKMKLKGVTVVSLEEFEDKELLSVKKSRNMVEYYWTCTPSWPLYIFRKRPQTKFAVYLDSDMFFYSDGLNAVEEIGNKSILAVEHRFPKERKGLEITSGRFNVAFNVFRNDKIGITCLKRWRKQCLEWCYWRHEKGKLGDQMYLNEWPELYRRSLVISKNLGVDAAPWNISQYEVNRKKGGVYINEDRLICYHFHQFQILGPGHYGRVLGYTLPKSVIDLIYKPYEDELNRQDKIVKSFDPNFEIGKTKQDVKMLIWHRLAKYLGPFYWRVIGLFENKADEK